MFCLDEFSFVLFKNALENMLIDDHMTLCVVPLRNSYSTS